MDPFVRRLVERLFDPTAGLSRNRHFHTFDNEEGRQALKITKRLKSLASELEGCQQAGGEVQVATVTLRGVPQLELRLMQPRSKRTARLEVAEYELLLTLPAARAVLEPLKPPERRGETAPRPGP